MVTVAERGGDCDDDDDDCDVDDSAHCQDWALSTRFKVQH